MTTPLIKTCFMKHIGRLLLTSLLLTGTPLPTSGAESGDSCKDEGCGAGKDSPTEALLKKQCEHKIPSYTCDECRYELGVVKVAPAVLAAGTNGTALVQTSRVARQKATAFIEAIGEIRLNDNATVRITPPIPGILRTIKVDVGDTVKAGELLAELESAELGETLGTYIKGRSLTAAARRAVEREKELVEKKVSARMDQEEAQTRYEEQKAGWEATTQKLKVMGLSESEIAAMADGTTPGATGTLPLRAPQAGTIIEKQASAGNRIEPGTAAMTLSNLETVWAWLDLYEHDLAALPPLAPRESLPITLETRTYPGQRFEGRLEIISAVMDETTRTVKARAAIPNPDGQLRAGMFCKARIPLASANAEVLAIPRNAVLEDEGKAFVFRHLKDDYYLRTPVKTGRALTGTVEIQDGLAEGDTVVTEGAFLLKSDVLREKMGAGCAD